MVDRFWAKVQKSEGCWVWTAAALPRGYGRFFWRGKPRYAHRVSLEMSGVSVPDDRLVMHTCDNPRCVNPSHLRVATQTENMRDAAAKGRTVNVQDWTGERNPKAKLSAAQVVEIGMSKDRTKLLSDRFGVSTVRIQQIRRAAKSDAQRWLVEAF